MSERKCSHKYAETQKATIGRFDIYHMLNLPIFEYIEVVELSYLLSAFHFLRSAMQSDTGTSVSSSLQKSQAHSDPPQAERFTLSKDDIDALREYVDEFPEADADRQSTIIANAMADIVEIRPRGQTFNKIDASKVRYSFYVWSSDALI